MEMGMTFPGTCYEMVSITIKQPGTLQSLPLNCVLFCQGLHTSCEIMRTQYALDNSELLYRTILALNTIDIIVLANTVSNKVPNTSTTLMASAFSGKISSRRQLPYRLYIHSPSASHALIHHIYIACLHCSWPVFS